MWKGFSSCQGLPLKKRSNNPAPPSLTMKIMKHIFQLFLKNCTMRFPKFAINATFLLEKILKIRLGKIKIKNQAGRTTLSDLEPSA